jgi:predicted nuclease of predicted toxin-antitoxin system
MKLLFDHNLPPLLVSRLADLFPESQHLFTLGLDRSSDWEIREYARQNNFFIVTKDADFSDLCVLSGFPQDHLDSPRKLFSLRSR